MTRQPEVEPARLLPPPDRAAARSLRHNRAAAGRGRRLWRHELPGRAADARDRHPGRARRAPRRGSRLVIGRALQLAAIGLALGSAAAFGLTRYLRSLLFEVTPTDPAVFAAVAVLMVAVAAGACLIPARRALRVDPLIALRWE